MSTIDAAQQASRAYCLEYCAGNSRMHSQPPKALAICTRSGSERQALSQKMVHGKLYMESSIHSMLATPSLIMNAADQNAKACFQI